MRFLHISDVHLGKTLRDISRDEDVLYFFNQVIDILKKEKVNLLLVTGDFFDSQSPPHDSLNLSFEFFLKLRDLNVEVVFIRGNHDSQSLLDSFRDLLKLANVHVYTKPQNNIANNFFERENYVIVAIPYINYRAILPLEDSSDQKIKSYSEKVSNYINYLTKNAPKDKIIVLAAHLMVSGSVITNTEKSVSVSEFYAVPGKELPNNVSYIALGHVHKYQEIKDSPSLAYYVGSPYKLDFSEENTEKYINLIDIDKFKTVHVEPIKLSIKNELKTFYINESNLNNELEKVEKFNGYVKIFVDEKDPKKAISIKNTIEDKISPNKVIYVVMSNKKDFEIKDLESLSSFDPLKLYQEYYKFRYGADISPDIKDEFVKILDELNSEVNENE